MIINYIKNNKILSISTLFLTIILCSLPPMMELDSTGYINADITRTFMYPAFLYVMRLFFGEWYVPVVIIQTASGMISILYALENIKQWFNISRFLQFTLWVVLMLPYVIYTHIGQTILTEPICYPLFIVFFVNLLKYVFNKNTKFFYISILSVLIMMLTRKQFSLFFGVFYFIFALEYLAYKRFNFIRLFAPIVFFICGTLAEYSYVYHKTGRFSSSPHAVQYVATPLFIAKNENIDQLSSPQEKAFLTAVLHERDEFQIGLQDPYSKNYQFWFPVHMKYEVVHDFYRYYATPKALDIANIPLAERDALVKKISFELIKLNFRDYFFVYSKTLIHALGGYYPFAALFVLFILSTIGFIQFKINMMLFLSLSTFLQFLDYGVVALVQPILRRFVFYTDSLYLISIILLCAFIYNYLKKEVLYANSNFNSVL